MSRLKSFLIKNAFLIGILVGLIVYSVFQPYDDTDDIENKERSGLRLLIDHGTGCHYISSPHGFFGKEQLVRRVDKSGNHICKGK